ncbi:acetyltransferase (GNAT) family protein [Kribbella sp. VKM Ac-2569]|uniref:GNAT family N-acetyltransferase n=1 Tax=Kribbella sp. VKM Ac-2569 TaxID=2512220 RepID=UPI00102B0C33|nr:GNAT family N-acetyltransferase [Kribbella sp. VKM Ac-2569]RZT26956.1 acetyltransferase (GNAT) family protein [Kribbella sp. VKM Ac-2569]
MNIRTAQRDELPALQELEVAAGVLFRNIGMTDVAEHPPPALEIFEQSWEAGQLWVSVDDADKPTGFVFVKLVDGGVHIEQVSVHPDHQGHGIGRQLIEYIGTWAAEQGFPVLTLSTFRSVPWNAPYYARLGFTELPAAELTPGLTEILAVETAFGLDPAERIFMRRPVARE